VGKHTGRRPLEDPGIDRRIILKWMFAKWDGGMYCVDLARIGTGGGLL
jgi:hypothetical protein